MAMALEAAAQGGRPPSESEADSNSVATTPAASDGAASDQSDKSDSGIVMAAYLKKLKTHRRKYFVLKAEAPNEASARLEYYDSERKFQNGQPPKRVIPLKNCFNINKKTDSRYKNVIALYTKDDCFAVALENAEEMDRWLKALLKLQHGEELESEGEAPKPLFEHVWEVEILCRGLGCGNLIGNYKLCLRDKTLSFIKNEKTNDHCTPYIEVNLINIRSCGNLKDFLFLEIGRQATMGPGEIWMKTEDGNIAQNVHATIFNSGCTSIPKDESPDMPKSVIVRLIMKLILRMRHSHKDDDEKENAMSGKNKEGDLGPRSRNRSSSATESSKPHGRASTPAGGALPTKMHPILAQGMSGGRERCDSMPSRARTTSEGGNHVGNLHWNQNRAHLIPHRPSSFCNRDNFSHSPPIGSPASPPSVGCSTDSAGSSYSLADETDTIEIDPSNLGRYGHSLTPDEAIAEEECCPDSPIYSMSPGNYVPMTLHSSDDGYVDMSPRGRHNSPTASMSSVTSGTPSTDMRFAEYPLEKVISYFPPPEDATGDPRPHRAYSVGSRPEINRHKKYMEQLMMGQVDNRVRASSVGSKSKKGPNRVLPPTHHAPHTGNKSVSAPLLSCARVQGSHTSIGPMDDLMEMDFSRSSSINNSGYMDMRPGFTGGVPATTTAAGPIVNSGYVEMKPGQRPKETSPYVDMTGSPKIYGSPKLTNDYVQMDPRKNGNSNNNNYIDMSFNQRRGVALSPGKSSLNDDHMPMQTDRTPEGYVEMSLGRHQRHSSWDGEEKRSKSDKVRSQPIAIQSKPPESASPYRKYSTGTPPTMHLPLTTTTTSPYSSLPRQRSRKNSQRHDSSSSSSVTTPSSSSTIFPISLNSPASPLKPEIKVPASVIHTVYKKSDNKKTDNSNDYIPMDFCGGGAIRKQRSNTTSSNEDDYVNYDPSPGKENRRLNFDHPWLDNMRLDDSVRFRPINENKEDSSEQDSDTYEILRGPSRSSSECGRSSQSRPSSASSEQCSSSSSTLVGSRPDSVNSRPSSVAADVQLHYASLDLEDGNRSPRTVKSDNASSGSEPTLTYAAIDFVKSEGLRHNHVPSPAPPNAKVKH